MRYCIAAVLSVICLAVIMPRLSYSGTQDVEALVDQFKAATDIQRQQLQEQSRYSSSSMGFTVKNVEEADRFDERTDTRQHYYKIVALPVNTPAHNLYQLNIFYRDVNKVKDIKEGQKMEVIGSLVRITDELSQITLWYFGEDLTPEDKEMFK